MVRAKARGAGAGGVRQGKCGRTRQRFLGLFRFIVQGDDPLASPEARRGEIALAGQRYWSGSGALPPEGVSFPVGGRWIRRGNEPNTEGASRVSSDGPVHVAPHGVAFVLGTPRGGRSVDGLGSQHCSYCLGGGRPPKPPEARNGEITLAGQRHWSGSSALPPAGGAGRVGNAAGWAPSRRFGLPTLFLLLGGGDPPNPPRRVTVRLLWPANGIGRVRARCRRRAGLVVLGTPRGGRPVGGSGSQHCSYCLGGRPPKPPGGAER